MIFSALRCRPVALALLSVWCCFGSSEGSDIRPLWGRLEPGPFAVGFASSWGLDHSRSYRTAFDAGSTYGRKKAPRPVLVNRWYPAVVEDEMSTMCHGDYLEFASEGEELDRLIGELVPYVEGCIMEWTIGVKSHEASDQHKRDFDAFMASKIPCWRDAPPAEGSFPVVIYHAGYGSSFEDNSILCEYLASHGYVVVGSAFLNGAGKSFNIDGGESSHADIAFLIDQASRWSFADWSSVAAIGHSGGAHAVLGFHARVGSPLDAVVSLDTTQDYHYMAEPFWSFPTRIAKHASSLVAPLLVTANSHGLFHVFDPLTKCERHYMTFRDLDHNDFVSQGIQRADIASQREPEDLEASKRAETLRTNYEQLCTYVLAFLDSNLKNESAQLQKLEAVYREESPGGATPSLEVMAQGQRDPLDYDETMGRPPTPRQWHRILMDEDLGTDIALEIAAEHHESSKEAAMYHLLVSFSLLFELIEKQRLDDARQFASFASDLHPTLGRFTNYYHGRAQDHPTGRTLKTMLELLESDARP